MCKGGYDFVSYPAWMYFCNQGQWTVLGNPLGEGLPWPNCSGKISIEMGTTTLQNSPYLCVFKYARAVKQKVWSKAETEKRLGRDEARALCACETPSNAKPILSLKYPTVLQSRQLQRKSKSWVRCPNSNHNRITELFGDWKTFKGGRFKFSKRQKCIFKPFTSYAIHFIFQVHPTSFLKIIITVRRSKYCVLVKSS